jgi:hypothetical protein
VQDRLTWTESGAEYLGGKRGAVEFDTSLVLAGNEAELNSTPRLGGKRGGVKS